MSDLEKKKQEILTMMEADVKDLLETNSKADSIEIHLGYLAGQIASALALIDKLVKMLEKK
tara:strand:+ start:4140 stop:4322 length:183 start_codon:yes stop_codon:yes gene_type:complete